MANKTSKKSAKVAKEGRRESKDKNTRYLDIHADDSLDEAQLAAWVKRASLLPGERM